MNDDKKCPTHGEYTKIEVANLVKWARLDLLDLLKKEVKPSDLSGDFLKLLDKHKV